MDHLREIIQTLDPEYIKEFKVFLNRLRKKSQRKDLDLFKLLQHEKEYSRAELLDTLYPEDKNLEAYHATRKRLIKQLTDFIYMKRIQEDSTMEAQITGMISFCKFLFEANLKDTAWTFLKKAEALAQKGQHYSHLKRVYQIGIENSLDEKAPDIHELIQLKIEARQNEQREEDASTVNFLIRNQLQEAMKDGREINMEMLVIDTLRVYNIDPSLFEEPRLLFNIVSLARTVALKKKDFFNFEPYVIGTYEKLESEGKFDRFTHEYKVGMLYMIAHVSYRNKKFDQARHYCDLLYEAMLAFKKSQYNKYFQKYNLLSINIHTYSGDIEKANDILTASLKNKLSQTNPVEYNNTMLTLCINYFYQEKFGRAIRTYNQLSHSDGYYTKTMGREWVLRKDLIELLIQYELENTDIVDTRIKSIERHFYDLFKQKQYYRVKIFLKWVRKINNNPLEVTSKDFQRTVETSIHYVDRKIEDIQAMTFYCWIRAKMLKTNFYKLMVQMVNSLDAGVAAKQKMQAQ